MGTAGPLANDYRDWMKTKGVLMQPFSSLCGPCGTTELIDGPLVTGIGKKYGKSGAQVHKSLRVRVLVRRHSTDLHIPFSSAQRYHLSGLHKAGTNSIAHSSQHLRSSLRLTIVSSQADKCLVITISILMNLTHTLMCLIILILYSEKQTRQLTR